jgi:hypothetical protein
MCNPGCLNVGWLRGWLLVVIAAATGCVMTSAEFKLKNVGPGKAAIAGRLTIIYNGKIYTENCRAWFGAGTLQLSSTGIVLFVVPEGEIALERLECKDGSLQHVQIKGVHFVARPGVITDFGDIAVTWEAEGGFKASLLFGAIGGAIDAMSDDGIATVAVHPPAAEVREAFRVQTGVAGTWSASVATCESQGNKLPVACDAQP